MAALLLQELEQSEISKLPRNVLSKIERILSEQQYVIDSLKAQQEQFRVDNGKTELQVFETNCVKVRCITHHACRLY